MQKSTKFREMHQKEWKDKNPGGKDIIQFIIEEFRTQTRWHKALQHLKEKDEIENSPRDIGKLIVEAKNDILEECREEIAQKLFNWAWPHIQRGVVAGIAEWYKDQLLKRQFEED